MLIEFKQYIKKQSQINDILIAGDFNQFIGSNEIQKFYNEIRVQDVHYIINNVLFESIDRTFV